MSEIAKNLFEVFGLISASWSSENLWTYTKWRTNSAKCSEEVWIKCMLIIFLYFRFSSWLNFGYSFSEGQFFTKD